MSEIETSVSLHDDACCSTRQLGFAVHNRLDRIGSAYDVVLLDPAIKTGTSAA